MKYILIAAIATVMSSAYAEDPWTPSPLCPFPSKVIIRFPYEGDCSKYWECYDGARYPMDCPSGLEYNADFQRCDSAGQANCDPSASIVYPTFSHSTETTPSTGPTQNPGPAPECPFPSNEIIFYPVANNCSQYWECFQGHRYLMSCPTGLHWNDIFNYCDYPGNVNCHRNSTTTPAPITTTPSGSTSPTTPHPSCAGVLDGTYLPYPGDCSKFYECVGGKAYIESCPSGLLWNHFLRTCDYPTNVNCNRK